MTYATIAFLTVLSAFAPADVTTVPAAPATSVVSVSGSAGIIGQ